MEYRIGDIVSIKGINNHGDKVTDYCCDLPRDLGLNTSGIVIVGKEYFNGSYAKIVAICDNKTKPGYNYVVNYIDNDGKSLNLAFRASSLSLIKSIYKLIEIY